MVFIHVSRHIMMRSRYNNYSLLSAVVRRRLPSQQTPLST